MNRGAPRVTPESVLQKRRRRPKHRILPIPSAVPGLTRHRASSRGLQPLAIAAAPTCSTSGEAKGGGGRRRGAAGRGRARPTLLVPRRAAAARAGQGPPPAGVARFVGVRGGRNRHSRLAKGKVALPALAWTHRGARDLWPPPPEEPGSADRHRASDPKARPLRPRQTLRPTLQMQKLGSPNYKWQVRSRPGAWVLQPRPCTTRGGGRGSGSGARRWIRARAPAR